MKPFTTIAVVIFLLVAILQILRVVFAWEIMINGFAVPKLASYVAIVVATFMSFMLWREMRIP